MVRQETQLGDSHNFGRRVSLRGGRVAKPRAVLWEWLMLAAESPLRRLLATAAERDGLGAGAFDFLPRLKFYRGRGGVGGEVEHVSLEPLPRLSGRRRRELAGTVGRSLALWSWLGVADLHWENLVLGVDGAGRIVFAPLDIELMLADLSLPTETKLLPDPDPEYAEICRHAAGVRRALPYLGKPVEVEELLAMAAAYHGTLLFLERQAGAIAKLLASVPGLAETPLRVLLRSTEEYVRTDREALWPPLLAAESEQLERGDVPYFFRLYGRPGIHYYGDRSLRQLKRLPLKGDVPQLDPLLSLKGGLRSPSRQKLREEGLLTLLGAFDDDTFVGNVASEQLAVEFGARSLRVTLPGGGQLRSRRNLSGLVASVYLPCRCGEVRSVFVPPVTRCRALA